MIFAATGHRPEKLGGYGVEPRLRNFARIQLARLKPSKVITGMALGWDQAVAAACVDLDIPYIAAVPFVGQEGQWPEAARKQYYYLINRSVQAVVVSPGSYSARAMETRNRWMVDRGDEVLALFDGFVGGGTANCIHYAEKKGKPVQNLWDLWVL